MKKQLSNDHIAVRKVLIRYMADYTNSASAPTSVSGGFYAIHMTDTNMVWLGETASFKSVINRFNTKGNFADVVDRARLRGAKLELWLLTKPKQCSAQLLEDELINSDRLADRKVRDLTGPGKLYCIRHDISHDYFVLADRSSLAPTTLMSSFITRLSTMRGANRNQALDNFINSQTSDILKGTGFTITEIDKFDDNEDLWLRRQTYIDDCTWGNNLNWHSVN